MRYQRGQIHRLKVEECLPGGGGNEELVSDRYRVSVCDDEKVVKMDGGDGCTQM